MFECKAITRKWGNSLGVALPKEIAKAAHIKENQQLTLLILKQNKTLKRTFGMLKGVWKKSTQEMKDEFRAALYNE